jgi:hypothetical protein
MSCQPNKATENKKAPAPNTQPNAVTLDSHDTYYSTQQAPEKTTPDPPKWYAPFERPEWYLLGAAIFTLWILGRQTHHTRIAAEAAQKSADAFVSAERGWILASIRKTATPFPYTSMIAMPDIVKCELIFKNYGATPAIVESYSGTTKWAIPTFDFPLPPEYGEKKVARIILGPQEDRVIGTVFPVKQLPDGPIEQEILSFERAIFMGYVNYGGIFEGQRATKFCFGFDGESDSFIPIGPPPYNEIT